MTHTDSEQSDHESFLQDMHGSSQAYMVFSQPAHPATWPTALSVSRCTSVPRYSGHSHSYPLKMSAMTPMSHSASVDSTRGGTGADVSLPFLTNSSYQYVDNCSTSAESIFFSNSTGSSALTAPIELDSQDWGAPTTPWHPPHMESMDDHKIDQTSPFPPFVNEPDPFLRSRSLGTGDFEDLGVPSYGSSSTVGSDLVLQWESTDIDATDMPSIGGWCWSAVHDIDTGGTLIPGDAEMPAEPTSEEGLSRDGRTTAFSHDKNSSSSSSSGNSSGSGDGSNGSDQATDESPAIALKLGAETAARSRKLFRCREGECNKAVFTRLADLERHKKMIHTDESERESFRCDYGSCSRSGAPFFRKDHFREHLREMHREDLLKRGRKANRGKDAGMDSGDTWVSVRLPGSCSPPLAPATLSPASPLLYYNDRPSSMDKAARKAKKVRQQLAQLATTETDPTWWRCARCLERVNFNLNSWTCPRCNEGIEEQRKAMRIDRMNGGMVEYSDDTWMSN